MRIIRAGFILLAAASLTVVASCGKDEQEAQKFDRADVVGFKRDMSDVSSFRLANGITVYMQEERTDQQVAVEVLYRSGYTNDPKGKVQLAHLTEHMAIHCGMGEYAPGESYKSVTTDKGMLNAEAASDFIHIDYIVHNSRLEHALSVEADRLRGINCDDQTLRDQKKNVIDEFDRTLSDPRGVLTRFGLIALCQIGFGQTHVPISAGVANLTVEDVERFHASYYRPDDMVMILIGNFQKAEAEALVRKHFESIPARPTPSLPPLDLKRSTRATWDINGNGIYYIAPGPFETFREQIVLAMFGAYFAQVLNTAQDVFSVCQTTYCSNQVYRVGRVPFFIFAQPKPGVASTEVTPVIFSHLEQVLGALDDRRVESIKTGMVSFVNTSMLKPDVADYPLMHHQVIGQEALNIGIKHILRDGRTVEEFTSEIQSITPDEVRAVLNRHLARSAMIEIDIAPRL